MKKNNIGFWFSLAVILPFAFAHLALGNATIEPSHFDLRNVEGRALVPSIKQQNGGTCWTHGAIAAIESNLMVTGVWNSVGEIGQPNLAEYHLDWWNGFNNFFNADISPVQAGIDVHQGGDYRVSAAYFSRGDGAVRALDGQSYDTPPPFNSPKSHRYYVRDIEWLSTGSDLKDLSKVKAGLRKNGALGTAVAWEDEYYSAATHNYYEPPGAADPNDHAVNIVGWDDSRVTQAPKPGAWLARNSWGPDFGEQGYFWISYFDKHAGRDPDMGAVSYRNVEPLHYSHIYYHDYHGWRDTRRELSEAFNAFLAKPLSKTPEQISAVSFYTADDEVKFVAKVYSKFEAGKLAGLLETKEGFIPNIGFHTVDLDFPISLPSDKPFYIYLKLSSGGQAFDRTSDVPLLLGGSSYAIVESRAHPGESFYQTSEGWVDLTRDEPTANFCIKALMIEK